MDSADAASDAGQPAKKKAKRGWSEAEEALFEAALSLHGRDWAAVAKHIGTGRKTPSIRSHAQVWFLKRLRDGHALPAKMLESGGGFTLSGEPLNKYSAVATRFFGSADKVPAVDGVCSDEDAAQKHRRKPKDKAAQKPDKVTDKATDKTKAKKKKKKKKKKSKRKKYYDSSGDEDDYGFKADAAATVTAVRRSGRARRSTRDHSGLHETDPFGLRTDIEEYDAFVAGPLSERLRACKMGSARMPQPFRISYCANSLLIADVHSHLCLEVEIMGLLGGTYDAETGALHILRCYPLREEQQGSQSVAADPADHLAACERMREEDGLELVGWYHSHPCFENVPSNTDCHQHFIHKYDDELRRPYVGLIVSSWSTPDTQHAKSHFRFFNSLKESGSHSDAVYTPYQCRADAQLHRRLGDKDLLGQLSTLVQRYAKSQYDLYRTDCGDLWPEGNISRFEKLIASVRAHMMLDDKAEDENDAERFVETVRTLFLQRQDTWWVTNKPSADKENGNTLN